MQYFAWSQVAKLFLIDFQDSFRKFKEADAEFEAKISRIFRIGWPCRDWESFFIFFFFKSEFSFSDSEFSFSVQNFLFAILEFSADSRLPESRRISVSESPKSRNSDSDFEPGCRNQNAIRSSCLSIARSTRLLQHFFIKGVKSVKPIFIFFSGS